MVDNSDNSYNGNDFIRGLETNPCINGITKSDALEIKKIPTLESETNEIKNTTIPALDGRVTTLEQTTIPALDERVTALEQGSSGSEWFEIDISTYTNSQDYINDIFYEEDGETYTKYNMILYKAGNTKLFLKDSNVYDCFILVTQINTIYGSSDFEIDMFSTYLSDIFFTEPTNDDEYIVYVRNTRFNPTNSSFSLTETESNPNRDELKLFVMDYNPDEPSEPDEPPR